MKKSILIADDDLGLAEALAMRCETIGLDTIVVDNAQCDQFAMITEQPALAILDLHMPGANEGNILEVLAADPGLATIPIVLLTGQKDSVVEAQCESLQVQYMPKQANIWARLKDIISDVLDKDRDVIANRAPFNSPAASRRLAMMT